MGQSDFENLNEDPIMQENDLDYSETDLDLPEKEIGKRDKGSKAISKMKQSLEVQDLLGA